MLQRLCALCIALAMVLLAPSGDALALDVAVYGAPSNSSWTTDVVAKLQASGQFNTVDSYSVAVGQPLPTLTQLLNYDAVFVYSDVDYNDNVGLGNVLADYVDQGKGVVLGSFSFWVSLGFSIQGRLVVEGYLPVTTGGQSQGTSLTMIADVPSHGILNGVTSFSGGSGSFHNNPITTKAAATQVAQWSNGQPLISEWSVSFGSVVALNFFAPSSDARSDFWDSSTDGGLLLANALSWAAAGGCPDLDGDNYADSTCGGPDCDDGNAAVRPGAVESCDLVDQDCDGSLIDEFINSDSDPLPDCVDTDDDDDGDLDTTDCNPTNPAVYNGALELCDGLNTDCTGGPDFSELDLDNDGYMICTGFVDNGAPGIVGGDDCDDTDNQLNPGATELCDDVDSNCDGSLVDGFPNYDNDSEPDCLDQDDDNDGTLDATDCDDNNELIFPGATELCDLIDSDCDGGITDEFLNTDLDTFPDCVDTDDDNDGDPDVTDCNDTDNSVYAGATELCDLIDSDCDGELVDGFPDTDVDGTPNCTDLDDDNDTYEDAVDCAPLNAAIFPGATELCDELDSDCDGDLVDGFANADNDSEPDCIDNDTDNDGVDDPLDCAPLDSTIYPGATEACDSVDQDCDTSLVDEFSDLDSDGQPDCIDTDADGDLFEDFLDCDDLNPTTYPGATEVCDLVDSDCDGSLVDNDPDLDGDGTPDCVDNDDDGDIFPEIVDCDDQDASVYPGAPDFCDLVDADCDGSLVDNFPNLDGDSLPDCVDDDIDGDGDPNETDCNDVNPAVYTGATESCDTIDSDCDGSLVDEFGDVDGDTVPDCIDSDSDNDTFLDAVDCQPFDSTMYPGALEVCDNFDGDCDGDLVDGFPNFDSDNLPDCVDPDADGDGFSIPGDCEDLNVFVFPGAAESCDNIDSDCDGSLADEFPDLDGDTIPDCVDLDVDGDGDPAVTDCDDLDPLYYTNAVELCDTLDFDCDGDLIDGFPDTDGDLEPDCIDLDDDGDFDPDSTDCGPLDPTMHWGAFEYCDAIDSDCDGSLIDGYSNPDGDAEPSCIDDNDDNDAFDDFIDCGPEDDTVYPGAPEFCDGVDSDCDGTVADTFPDWDLDDLPDCWDPDDDNDGDLDASDCDDFDDTIYTDAPELCDLIDSDCDGSLVDFYPDFDGDGEPDCNESDLDGDGFSSAVDCDDGNPAIYPGAPEYCDPFDSNCDGDLVDGYTNTDSDLLPDCIDDDDDNDGYDDIVDCLPTNPSAYPGATELCDVLDSDCDGDMVDGFDNLDGDAYPDCVDADGDGDGAWGPDDCDDTDPGVFVGAPEACDTIDSDCDGSIADEFSDLDNDDIPDCADEDADGDGALASIDCDDLEKTVWPGAPEFCDSVDSDCDGDLVDGFTNTDGDEKPDCSDWDDDGDGVSDTDELAIGSDPLDPDTDGDGIDDGIEVNDPNNPLDSDGDHILDVLDPDDDGDGIPTADEGPWDPDGDGIPNYLDLDSDGDGFSDDYEGDGDPDADGTPSYLDLDSDGNGEPDVDEGNDDKDGDAIPDFLDIDDEDGPEADKDGDGLTNGEEQTLGTDWESTDSDGDGIDDWTEVGTDLEDPLDTDEDGTIDALDEDDDGDGIASADESSEDLDGDGEPDLDVDGDGILNHLDTDADGDGIDDELEDDGDFDGDDIPDYLDEDADGDGIPDSLEGSVDTDNDGWMDAYDLDSDGDGLLDEEEGSGDVDGDGLMNSQDLEADGDGALDAVEGRGDVDGDGTPNWLDPDDSDGPYADADGDGLTNIEEAEWGSDAYNEDSDGDGLLDGEEVHDYQTDPTSVDSDEDGLEDGDEVELHGTDPANYDTDADGLGDGEELDLYGTDPLLKDTDNDGLRDGTEILVEADPHDTDTDNDGIIDGPDGLGDEDSDGLINVLDPIDDRMGAAAQPAPDGPDPVFVMTGGASWSSNCGSSVVGMPSRPGLVGLLLLLCFLRRGRGRRLRAGRA
ncbi:MAG: MopE-related protein [Myxococcota bacterium]|nr:MopE-related protein [Myxococcota bacterium]